MCTRYVHQQCPLYITCILSIVMFISHVREVITTVAYTVYFIKYRHLQAILVAARPKAWAVFCQVEVSASGRSLVQRSRTECGVSECDHEVSIMRPWSRKKSSFIYLTCMRSPRHQLTPYITVRFPQISPPKPCIHFSPLYVLHAPPIFLLWSPELIFGEAYRS